ncbi:xenotropic and polytropic retrovirus receptor 1 [Marchantia polymorpha subsp. ruderalis]|uniref:EXS domain-containing protein n=2 Tax=Marchantia polymorpha TaxID=3197 RepID=A0AAF6AU96_MARPO|nr:hypothetical protein MARPO_0002s0301 [Marchantia polymorpha]BBN00017.1 hypothetical protein Mp_1g25750 [Marchantia polymorpha subsp. ruderalis]|eukprot:PTQ49866.1 hypothetical protein MARPO_0002s0301 [Marchantia polymorpha]
MELALEFFRRLDAELNRVNRFYKLKEEEYTLRAHTLQLQMATLLELRKALARDGGKSPGTGVCVSDAKDENKSEAILDVWSIPPGQEGAISKKQVQHAEKLLRTAFADFYRGLGLLKSYSSINIMAFSKILKKFDKVTGWSVSATYLRAVETSYFASSEKVVKLMDRVENIFTLHLAKRNHREAMIYLRPLQDSSSNFLSFFLGIFTGCSVALLSILVLKGIIPLRWESGVNTHGEHMRALISVSSTVGLVLLHLYMYGWNVYLWRGARVNYALIFEWAPGTELQYQQVLLLSTGLTSLWMLALIVVKLYPTLPYSDLVPFLMFLVILVILFLPLDFCYRSTRVVFLRCMIQIMSAPFHKVVLADIFLADQLCSQVTAMRNIQFLICYYFEGYFDLQDKRACTSQCPTFRNLQYVVAMLPSWWRLMQCARRWMDDGEVQQVLNGGKYLSALIAAVVRVAYVQSETGGWLIVYVACSLVSSLFGVYWDTVRDWGLLQAKSANPWLRDHLLLKHRGVYYISMVTNIVLRMAWLFAVVVEETSDLDRNTVDLVLATLEVIRRGHWNFYRLEYQHLHNFGDFTALKQMALPFQDSSIQACR